MEDKIKRVFVPLRLVWDQPVHFVTPSGWSCVCGEKSVERCFSRKDCELGARELEELDRLDQR